MQPGSSPVDRLRGQTWADLPLLLLLGLAVHVSLVTAGFTLDDGLLIASLGDRAGETLGSAFTRDFWGITAGSSGYYRPLTSLYFAAVYRLAGPSPAVFHLLSVLLHLGAGAALHGLLRRVTRDTPHTGRLVAALGTGIFLLHPMQQEAIAFVAAVNDLWATVAVVLCAWAWIAGRPLAAAIALLVGLLFKENAAAALVFIAAHDALHGRVRPLHWLAPAAAAAVYAALRVIVAGVGLPGGGGASITPWAVASFAGHYTQALALPFSVGAWRPLLAAGHAWWALPAAVAGLAAAGSLVRRAPATLPALLTAAAALALTLPAVLHGGFLADRFAYLPLAGGVVALATAAARMPPRPLALAGGLFLFACGTTTVTTIARWQDQITLMSQAELRDPTGLAGYELGKALAAEGRVVEALAAFERSAGARWPHLPAFGQSASMQLTLGRPDRALAAIDEGLAAGLAPTWQLRVNRATALRLLSQHDEAMVELQRALALAPDEPDIFAHVAVGARAADQHEVHDRAVATMVAMGVRQADAEDRVAFLAGEAQR